MDAGQFKEARIMMDEGHAMGEMQATLDDFGIMHYCLGEFNDQARGASQILSIA